MFRLNSCSKGSNAIQVHLDVFMHQPMTPSREKKITTLISKVIVGNFRPINLVVGDNFKKLITQPAPGCNLPSRQTFIFMQTQNLSNFATMLASWFNYWFKHQYRNAVIHHCHHPLILSNDSNMKNYVLSTKLVMKGHTGENIASWM